GKPIDIKGEIYDSNNELVSTFESVHDGMGKTQLLPIEGKNYYAKIKTESGFEFQQDLPKPLKLGYTLSYRNFKGKNIVSISTNPETLAQNPNATLSLICKFRGNSYLETTQTLTETTLSFELPKDKIPEGINQITLFDSTIKPQSERLVYFEKEHDLEVELSSDKEIYEPNEKAFVYISSTSKEGVAKSASFSLSVTDTNGVDEENFDSNICSYFLMESDIRGKVHHPGYYFDSKNLKRLEHLDNLLLTQGWRDFVWKTVPKSNNQIDYKVEKGINISGRVKQVFADKPLVNNNLTLALMGKKSNGIFSAVTDSIGRFQFENLEFSGKTKMYLNTRDEKGKFKGEMLLDSIERSPMNVSLQKETVFLSESTNTLAENVLKKFTAFGVKPENVLDEVVVKAKYPSHMVKLYGVPDYSYNLDKEDKEFTNILDVWDKVPSLFVGPTGVLIQGEKGYPPLILIDGYPALPGELDMLSPSDVLKVDVIRGKLLHSLYILSGEAVNEDEDEKKIGGTISIVTTGKRGNKLKEYPNQTIKQELEGYYNARTFYSPNPENPNPDLDKNSAFRNTIYWNPYVHPDKAGSTSVEFYNSKVESKVKVALEGITGSGIPVVKRLFYSIKE
ncbi:TonB-dependent receptor, partial [Flavobacterium daejeonense]|uniref:hypothetical protein n=1 Tax=Flavobacterium daejeonense TaxID=350893 RepID=UPI00047A2D1A